MEQMFFGTMLFHEYHPHYKTSDEEGAAKDGSAA